MTTTAESPILVLGATGGQGGAVTAALLARQARVRAMVRRPGEPSVQRLTERGVEVMVGSLDDRAALGAAMEGAAAVFALTTPFEAGEDAEVAQGRAIVAAADDARVPHLVFSSVAGADQHTGVPHFDSKAIIEKGLAASGLPYTITAPTYFFDNALGGEGADRIAAGTLDLPLPPDRPLQQLARKDLARSPPRCCSTRNPTSGGASSWPATPSRRRRWPRRSAWLWADLCGTNKHRSSRSAIPICMRCGGSSTAPATGSTSTPCTPPTPTSPGRPSSTGRSTRSNPAAELSDSARFGCGGSVN